MPKKLIYKELEKRIQELEQAESKHKGNERALQEDLDKYRALIDEIPLLICSFLPGGEISLVNSAYCDYFGKTLDELIGSNFLSLIPDADQKTVMDNISALSIELPTQSHEHSVIALNGDIRWQHWTNRAIFDDRGKVLGYQSIGEDITERKRTEEALLESEERYRQLFNNESDAVMIFDATSKQIEDANPATLDLFEYSKDEFLNLTVKDISAEKDKTKAAVERIISGDSEGKYIPLRYFIFNKIKIVIIPNLSSAGIF